MRQWLIEHRVAAPEENARPQSRQERRAANAPFKFAPAEGTKFFEPHGWREIEFRSSIKEAFRLHRTMRMAWIFRILGALQPAAKREEMRRMGGIVLLDRI